MGNLISWFYPDDLNDDDYVVIETRNKSGRTRRKVVKEKDINQGIELDNFKDDN